MPSNFESFERSELARTNDHTDFERFLFEQEDGGTRIVGAQRDRLRHVVYLSNTDDQEMSPVNVKLSTREW